MTGAAGGPAPARPQHGGRSRPRWRWVAAGLASLCLLPAGAVGGDASRFLPWTDARTPPLALPDLAGRPHALQGYRGRVVLINFWATWCEPCREEMSSIQRLTERLTGQPFTVLAVNYGESETRVAEFVKRLPVTFPVLLDPNQAAPRDWRVRILPASFLVDGEGRVRYRVMGEIDWATDEALDAVRGLLRR